MRKLLSALLTLAMLLALTTPALAESAETTDWAYEYVISEEAQAWMGTHPQTTREFHANIDAYVAEEWPGYSSVAEMAEDWGAGSEEYIRAMLTEEWVLAQIEQEEWDAWLVQYTAANPGAMDALAANAYDYFAQKYSWYDSPEEYMADWGYDEEQFIAEMVEQQLLDFQTQEENRRELDQAKADLGGVPGQLGVMLNGAYISFPDAVPESVDGRIMVPYRALMEALGGDVAYDAAAGTVSCILDGTTLSLKLGENTLTIDKNGTVSTLEMDCAAYARDGRTYVPVRFVSQAFGYDVFWDPGFETAVLVDEEALSARIDEQFTILNRALNVLTPDSEQARQATTAIKADVTLFDSIAGDKSYHVDGTVSGVVQGGNAQGEIHFDLSALGELIDLETLLAADSYYEITEEERALAEQLLDSLADLSLEYIENAGDKTFYVRSPLLGLMEKSWEDAWLTIPADDATFLPGKLTMGGLCYQLALSEMDADFDPDWTYFYTSGSPVMLVENALTNSQFLADILGDGCFTHTSEGDVFTLDPAVLGLDDLYGEYNPFTELEFTFIVADSGAVTGSLRMALSPSAMYGLSGLNTAVVILDGTFSLGESRHTVALDLHIKNSFRLELEAAAEITPTTSAPLSAPPAGDVVIAPEDGL